jgi:hypothetical protein
VRAHDRIDAIDVFERMSGVDLQNDIPLTARRGFLHRFFRKII